ncbi:hypothetical protein [Egicoccus sp. AB-alg2]|uniref:hypothetical protein n=1 Tax=Egicoccus sp. AB-alg2 TaxID=3242693 RepID=UPI00359DE671
MSVVRPLEPVPAPTDVEHQALALVAELAAGLRDAGVRYCHWKSNEAIARSLSGDNDLDLLVAPEDAGRFLAVLHGLGFRAASPPPGRHVPGIVDLFGLDDATGRVVHAQAHFRLVVGDDMTKNVDLPLVAAYLDSCRHDGVLPLPSPEFEYLVLLVRMGLKHCAVSSQLVRQGRPTASERRELAQLEADVDPAEVERLRATHLPELSPALLRSLRHALAPDADRLTRARAGRRLLRALAGYARRPLHQDLLLRVGKRAWRPIRGRLPGGDPRRRPAAGGLMVAVLGGDGAGKSTTVGTLATALGGVLVTRTGHLGKPPRSLLTRVGRRMVRLVDGGAPPVTTPDTPSSAFPGHGTLVWHVLTARDRARERRRLHRAVAAGEVVVCDRHPLPMLRTMDGPRIARIPDLQRRPLARWLARAEARYYRRMPPPDLLLVLRASPDVALKRRPEQDRDFVRRRAEEIDRVPWRGRNVVVVDADRPLKEVQRVAARAVWDRL